MFLLQWPVEKNKYIITSRFGWRVKPKLGIHSGIDLNTPVGTDVKAAYKGVVVFAGLRGNYGLCVILEHPTIKNVWTLYAHLSIINVNKFRFIEQGEVIGKSGNTGWSTGPHLHFEVRGGFNGILAAKDPERYLA